MSQDLVGLYLFGLGAGWVIVLAIALIGMGAERVRARRRDWDAAFVRELEGQKL